MDTDDAGGLRPEAIALFGLDLLLDPRDVLCDCGASCSHLDARGEAWCDACGRDRGVYSRLPSDEEEAL